MGYLSFEADGPVVPIKCGATALAKGVVVDVTSGLAVIADADSDVTAIGVTVNPCAAGDDADIRLFACGGILKAACGEALDLGDVLYVGAAGTLIDTQPSGKQGLGIALHATTTAGDEVAFIMKNPYTDTTA